jgi:hypothetical protein
MNLCYGLCKARPRQARLLLIKQNVSITERPSLGQAALELRATPQLKLKNPGLLEPILPLFTLQLCTTPAL